MVQAILAATLIGSPATTLPEACTDYRGVAIVSLGMPGQFLVIVKPAGVAWDTETPVENTTKPNYSVIFHLFHKDRDYDILLDGQKATSKRLTGGESRSFDGYVNSVESAGVAANNGYGLHGIY